MQPEHEISLLNAELSAMEQYGGFTRWRLVSANDELHLSPHGQSLLGWQLARAGVVKVIDLLDRVHAGDRDAVRLTIRQIAVSKRPGQQEFRFWHEATSRWMVLRLHGELLDCPAENAPDICGFLQDITAMRESEDKLSRDRYLLETSEHLGCMGSWSLDFASGMYEYTGVTGEVLGFAHGERFISRNAFRALIHPDDIQLNDAVYREAVREGRPIDLEYRFWNQAESRWLTVRSIAHTTLDPGGQPMTMYGFTQDVTRQKESERALLHDRLLLDSAEQLARMGTWSLDLKSNTLKVSRHLIDLVGVPADTPLSMPYEQSLLRLHPDDLEKVATALAHGIKTHEPIEIEYRRWNPAKSVWMVLKSVGRLVLDERGHAKELHGLTRDITEQKEARERLRLAASVFEHSRSMILIADAGHNIVQLNRAFCEICGYRAEELIHRAQTFGNVQFPGGETSDQIWIHVESRGFWQGEVIGHRKNHEPFPMMLTLIAVRDESGQIEHYISIGDDITREKAAEEKIRQLAYFDSLTELPNRVLIRDRVEQAISLSHRQGAETALLFVDLDYFKHVNDSLGHAIGDNLLRNIAQRLAAQVRAADTVARLGGDEFLVLLPHAGAEAAGAVAAKLIEVLQQPAEIEGHSLTVTPSIGISLYPRDGVDFNELLRLSDAAMYRAKESGRSTYLFYTPEMNEATRHNLKLTNDLRHALKQNELVLFYQPQISIADHAVIGAEALLRWMHPVLGMVSPLEFIPLAEESGLIDSIGSWVLHKACEQAANWTRQGLPALTIAVNCSVRQFLNPVRFLEVVRAALESSQLSPERLELEITESVIIKDIGNTLQILDQLQAMGVQIAVDDFGTGYSSLSYLKRMPIDKLKIDRSFVHDLIEDADDRAIAAMVVALGHALNLKVVAEGVEAAAHLDILKNMQCDEGQGYLWAKPMPASEFAIWLADY